MQIASNLTLELSKEPFLLEKRIKLLRAIARTGSISKAAKAIAMSYKSAWEAVDAMNNLSHTPILIKATGGIGGGGSRLTSYGENLLTMYQVLKEEQEHFLKRLEARTDMDTATLKTIGRLAMQISARNQIQGNIEHIESDGLMSKIHVVLKSGHHMVSVITNRSVDILGLKCHDTVSAIFKSNTVRLEALSDHNHKRENCFEGSVIQLDSGASRKEVVVDIGHEEHLISVLSTSALERLNLSPGSKVYVVINASDVMLGC